MIPDARGMRNHRLHYSSELATSFRAAGFEYMSNELAFLQPFITAHLHWTGLVNLPIWCEDDVLVHHHPGMQGVNLDTIYSKVKGTAALQIFSFHPVHVFLNTRRLDEYKAAKSNLLDEAAMTQRINMNSYGIQDLLQELLSRISSGHLQAGRTLLERALSVRKKINPQR